MVTEAPLGSRVGRLAVLLLVLAFAAATPVLGGAGQPCPGGASFASLGCRLGALATMISGGLPAGKLQKQALKLTTKSLQKVKAAEKLAQKQKARPSQASLGKADKGLAKLQRLLEGAAAGTVRSVERITLGAGVDPAIAALLAEIQGIRGDIQVLRVDPIAPPPVLDGFICCLKDCAGEPTDGESSCAVVNSIPCSFGATGSVACDPAVCYAKGCLGTITALGITCDIFAECTGPATCSSIGYPDCVP